MLSLQIVRRGKNPGTIHPSVGADENRADSVSQSVHPITVQTANAVTTSAFVTSIQAATAKLFRELIDITTQVEVEYILQRLA